MDIAAPTFSALSLEHFECFINQNPDATNIIVSNDGCITVSSAPVDDDQTRTKEAFKAALKGKYPDQGDLVDEAWDGLKLPQKSWDAHTISQVIDQAAKNESEVGAIWKDVGEGDEEQISQEEIQQLAKALDDYAEEVVGKLSPEEQEVLRQQLTASGFAVGGAGFVGLAANVSTPAANHALANLLATVSASLPHGAALPTMGAASPGAGHLAAATLMMGASATATSASIASAQAAIIAAGPAIATCIIAGAIAHRLYVAARRVSSAAHRIEHEVNNITVAMMAAAFATIPPAQHAMLLSAIIGGVVGQHIVDPGVVEQGLHNMRDAALGVYLFNHPEVAVTLGDGLKSLFLSAGKAVMGGSGVAATTSATTTTSTTGVAASTTSAGTALTHITSASILPHSIHLMSAHSAGAAATAIATVIAAHPAVMASILVGGACAAAYSYVSSSSTLSQDEKA